MKIEYANRQSYRLYLSLSHICQYQIIEPNYTIPICQPLSHCIPISLTSHMHTYSDIPYAPKTRDKNKQRYINYVRLEYHEKIAYQWAQLVQSACTFQNFYCTAPTQHED